MSLGVSYKTVHVARHQNHLKWSKHTVPVATVSSGDVVAFDAIDGSNGQIVKESGTAALESFDIGLADPVFGPVFIHDAEPGDALRIEILALEVTDWGWTAIVPGFGLLADEFPDPDLKIWMLRPEAGFAKLRDGVQVALRPFLGIMGVAPGLDGELSTIPPTDVGGNIDCRDLTAGTTLYLPVHVPGALFSCGDGHAAQGHGEVCGTAIETSLKATLRLTVCKNHPWVVSPHFQTAPEKPSVRRFTDKGRYATMGIDSDLLHAAKKAVRYMIEWLVATKGLTRNEAYMLASVAADLQIVEIVDLPNYAVTLSLPLNVFV
jgi:acetamidase/formamidase